MAIGDPWDSSYNPSYPNLRNQRTGKKSWWPDASDETAQDDPLSFKDRRGGRFCTEGCGCIDTGCDNLAGAKCQLPPEIAVTLIRDPNGRYSARAGIEGGAGETYHLKYSNGAWRGSRCCSQTATDALSYACDPCKVTTLPNGKPSECHYANNKYVTLDSDKQVGDAFEVRDDFNYDDALEGDNWPRRGADAWMKPEVYGVMLPGGGTDMLNPSVRDGERPVCWDVNGVPNYGITTEDDCIDINGLWSENDPSITNNNVEDRAGQKLADLKGTNLKATQFSENKLDSLINIKARERRIFVTPEGYYAHSSYNAIHGSGANKESACFEDGAVPLKKTPWCRHPFDATEVEAFCTNPDEGESDCESSGATWLLDNKEECTLRGLCYSPKDGEPTVKDQLINPVCLKRPTDSSGTPTKDSELNQYECEVTNSHTHDWHYETEENCVLYSGEEVYAGCYGAFGTVWEGDVATEEDCIAEPGRIWKHPNVFISYDFVDWEYERQSCCGQTLLDEDHPFHTPQISGGAANTRKNTVCITPYSEVILAPSTITGSNAPQTGAEGTCTSVGNQQDRVLFHLDGESYWTLTIRPCNFWGACLEKGVPRPDPYDIKGQQDNYFDTTCGEEVMLFLPIDQFMNCSNFNLTLGKESQLRSGWPESQPLWDPKMGNQMGNPVSELFQKGAGGMSPALGFKGPIGYFPGDAIEGIQHEHWCSYPDVNYDGIADGGAQHCQKYHYYNHNKGSYFGELQNAKGADAFYGFNIQPQPFKATEEKQNRAKGPDEAAVHHKYWQVCVDHILGHMNGGGHWFWNYGPDYFMYYDFVAWDEMTIGTGPVGVRKSDGFCNEVATKAKKYVDEHVGFLRRGDCGYGNGALWVGWIPFDGWTNNLSCPECEEQTKASCGTTGSCVAADGSFEHATPEDCEASGGKFNICCEWFEGCDQKKLVNFKDVIEKNATPIFEEAKTEAECVKPMDEGGAGGNWSDGCSPAGIALAENQECPQVQPVPEAFVDIVFGKSLGQCQLEDGTLIQDYETEEACDSREGDNTWTGTSVGGSDSSYPLRELEGIIKARPSGPSTNGLVDTSSIKKGFSDKVGGGYSRRILGSEGSDTGNSMSYWHDTGLFPKGEMASYVNDHCLGIKQHKRIQYASNEKPIKITSRNHLLVDGDLVHTYNVMGNFGANVMYQRDWQEMQWEDKLHSPCTGENCENQVWPDSICPYTSACLDDSQGKCIKLSDDSEVDLKKEDCLGPVYKWDASTDAGSKLECEYGACSKKREDGTVCDRKTDCEADADICKMQDDDGKCPSGFTVDPDKAPGEECGCVKDDADGPPGCGGVWEGGGGTWELSCDSKYYACSGEIILGRIPPPADFFVAKNVTLDTFDLYTCDKYPVDGRIINKANIDTTECVEEVEEGCIMNYRLGIGQAEAPEQVSWITKKLAENRGIPSQEPTQFRCLDTYTGKLSFQNNGKSTHIPTGDTITNSETSGAPVDEEHTCYKTQSDGGKACAEADCDALGACFNTVDKTGALDENGNPKKKENCTGFDERWTTSWRNYDTFEDDDETADNEAEINCALYGTCTVVAGYHYNVNAFMKKEDCDALAEVYTVYDPSVGVDHKNQLYVNRCQDADAKLLNDKDLHSGTTEEQKKACESKGKCYDYDGDVVSGINNSDDCENSGFEFKGGEFIEGRYADCVRQADEQTEDRFKECWSQAWYGDIGILDVYSETSGGRGKPGVGVYKTCPFTGEFDYWGNHEDSGVEAGYIGHYENNEIDTLYRFGFGGPGYKWEERANDYYVQIEQKGICPVCCDHFMPERLVATLTGQPSSILDYIGCGMDECEAPTADDSQSFDAAKALKNEGYCCSDEFHTCDLSDLAECEDEFKRHIADPNNVDITFGTCTESGGRVRTFQWRKKGCDGSSDTFTPLTHSGGVSECNMFLRKRPTLFGGTNCRKCSSVYTSRSKTKTVSETGNTQVQYIGLDKDGKETDCCADTAYCEALISDNNNDIIGNCSHPYLPCKEARSCAGLDEKNCSSANEGEVIQVTSALTATCTKTNFDDLNPIYIWAFDPCSCYPNFVEMKYQGPVVEDIGDGTCDVNGNGDEGYDNDAYTGCGPTHITTDADETCVDHANSHEPVDETCPGLQSLDVPMEYDGVVWRSEWTLMNTVGTHQCDLGLHRFKWPSQCQPTGPNLDFSPYTAFKSGDELVAINADCDACDMPQYGGISGGVLVDGTSTDLIYRNAKPPSLPQDGHFIRLVMGCGNSIPSIAAYNSGDIVDGGFGPNGADNYRKNGLDIWAEITNCTFTDFIGSEGLRVDNVTSGIAGTPPCDTGGLVGCLPKNLITGDSWRKTGKPSALERRYAFAGRCISKHQCGPRGACVDTECCTYTGVDYPLRTGAGSPPIRAPLWSGGVACTTGGDIQHRCQTYGFDPIPNKPAEQFTVQYVKDVNSETGEATLVIPAYPPTFGGRHCAYEKGTPIGIGLAELQQAETDTFGSYSRSNKSRNPYLPAGGTILNTDIPRGDNTPDKDGDAGRGSGQYMEIKVADVSKLITKNPRKNRHLRIYDRTRTQNGNPVSATTFDYMNMKQNLELPQPYGLNPWPVDHQTHSSTGSLSMWPKGVPMGPSNVESLRKDPTGSITQPGRIGPKPTVDNLNRMFRYKEVDTGGGMTTPIPEIMPVEPVMINAFENIYSDEDYFCTNNVYKNNSTCVGNGHLWMPHFSHTEVATHYDHDLADAEKVVISGSVVYPATCKGTRMGYCVDDLYGLNVSRMDINECSEGACVDVATNSGITDSNGDPITDKDECDRVGFGGIPNPVTPGGQAEFQTNGEWVQLYEDTGDPESPLGMDGDEFLCERIFGGEWVIGRRNDEKDGYKYKDPLNLKPLEISGGQKTGDAKDFFMEGCPVGCQINGFYLKDPCEPPSEDFPQGQCFECVEIEYEDSEGNEQREMRCPRSPADGSYVVRNRGCQNAKYDNREDCKENGWHWWEPVTAATRFAIHDELELVVHDASQLRSNLEANKPIPRFGQASDWEYDLSQKLKTVTKDAGFFGEGEKITEGGLASRLGSCEFPEGTKWENTDGDIVDPPSEVDTKAGCEQHFCTLYEIDNEAACTSRGLDWVKGVWINTCGSVRGVTFSSVFDRCVDLNTLDQQFPHYFPADDSYVPDNSQESLEMARLCDMSDSCESIRPYKECRDVSDDQAGTCIYLVDGNEVTESVIASECGPTGVFIGPVIQKTKKECGEAGLTLGASIDTQIINEFVCIDSNGSTLDVRTPAECTKIVKGTVKYLGKPVANSADDRKLNLITQKDTFLELSSPEAMLMGHEVGIGLAPRNFKGVIYAPQAENEKYNEYADPHWRAVWSRHGGAFDIIIGYPPPVNNCRQGNSDKPVNMDFYLGFDQICCNERGPLNYHQCTEKCWTHYLGPHFEDMELRYGTHGDSIMHVNIHE